MKKIKDKKVNLLSRENLHIWALLAVILAVSVPLMTNYCIKGVDVGFYVKLLGKVCPGNVFLLFPSLLVRVGMGAEAAYKLFLFGLNVATVMIAYLCFRGIFQDRVIGVIGCMLYVWTPYRVNDLYCRADLGEAVALCFLPIVFYGLYRVYQGKNDGHPWIILAAGYTLIFQAYLLSFLVIAGFTVLFCLLAWKRMLKRPRLAILLKTVAAFLVCNAWSILSILLGIRNGSFSRAAFRGELIQGKGVYPSVFLQLFFVNGSSFRTEGTGTENIQPLGVGFAVTAGVLVYLWLAFVGRHKDKKDVGEIRGFGRIVGIVGGVVAVLATNCFPWDYLQRSNSVFFRLIESLQSPARLMQLETVCFVLLTCAAVWQVKRWENPYVGRALAITVAVTALISVQYLTGDILYTGEPRSLYGVEYGEAEGTESLQPENLDISPWDYGKYMSFYGEQ